jgi:hypothetical protein
MQGNDEFVMQALALLGGLAPAVVSRAIAAQSAKGMTALAWKAGLGMRFGVKLQVRLARIAPRDVLNAKNGTDYPMTPDEMNWMIGFFNAAVRQSGRSAGRSLVVANHRADAMLGEDFQQERVRHRAVHDDRSIRASRRRQCGSTWDHAAADGASPISLGRHAGQFRDDSALLSALHPSSSAGVWRHERDGAGCVSALITKSRPSCRRRSRDHRMISGPWFSARAG